MGDVDVSSKGAFFSSLRGSTAAKTPPAVTPSAAALAAPKRDFDPPPVRRVTPSATPVIRTARTPTPEPEPEREQEKEAGEWVVALYDYAGV